MARALLRMIAARDQDQDLVIRKTRVVMQEPHLLEAVAEAGPYLALGNGAWVPKRFALRVYDL